MVSIAIIRHGNAKHNQVSEYSWKTKEEGGADHYLIPGQEEKACGVAQQLISQGFDSAPIWCSPLQRTKDTVALLQQAGLKGRVTYHWDLREVKAGDLEGHSVPNTDGLTTEETWMAHVNHSHVQGGGESFYDVMGRMRTIAEQLLNQKLEKVIVVTHGTPSRALILHLTGENVCLDQWGVYFV